MAPGPPGWSSSDPARGGGAGLGASLGGPSDVGSAGAVQQACGRGAVRACASSQPSGLVNGSSTRRTGGLASTSVRAIAPRIVSTRPSTRVGRGELRPAERLDRLDDEAVEQVDDHRRGAHRGEPAERAARHQRHRGEGAEQADHHHRQPGLEDDLVVDRDLVVAGVVPEQRGLGPRVGVDRHDPDADEHRDGGEPHPDVVEVREVARLEVQAEHEERQQPQEARDHQRVGVPEAAGQADDHRQRQEEPVPLEDRRHEAPHQQHDEVPHRPVRLEPQRSGDVLVDHDPAVVEQRRLEDQVGDEPACRPGSSSGAGPTRTTSTGSR